MRGGGNVLSPLCSDKVQKGSRKGFVMFISGDCRDRDLEFMKLFLAMMLEYEKIGKNNLRVLMDRSSASYTRKRVRTVIFLWKNIISKGHQL